MKMMVLTLQRIQC